MFEVNVTVKCPDLLMAATVLAKAVRGGTAEPEHTAPVAPVAPVVQPQIPAQPAPATMPQMTQAAAPQMPPVQPSPVAPFPAAAPVAQMPMPGTGAPTVPTAPTAPGPAYTLDQIGKAGAELIGMNPGKMAELTALLQQFGIPAITELKPEQFGPFATALRGLGARI